MRRLHGRILDTFTTGEARAVVVAAGRERLSVDLAPGERAPAPGDLVTLALGERGARVEATHASPGSGWDPAGDATRWRTAEGSSTRMDLLWQRQAILRAVRDYFYEEGFLEVQAPLLLRGTCPDAHIDSLEVGDAYLTTSTEYQIKRLEVGGFDRVFTLTQNFRGGDLGDRHNPEFTMLEWARAFGSLDDIERDAEALARRAFRAVHPQGGELTLGGRAVVVDGPPWERVTVREAFARHLGMDLDAALTPSLMRSEALRVGIAVPPSFLEDDHLLFSFLVDAAQAHLGAPTPVFLREWPASMTSSAALLPGAPALTERSELIVAGLELSDGFPSLRDPAVQARLFARELDRRARDGKQAVRLDERYLEALRQGIPPGAGMALGFDRLVMVITGQSRIRDVLTFAWDEL